MLRDLKTNHKIRGKPMAMCTSPSSSSSSSAPSSSTPTPSSSQGLPYCNFLTVLISLSVYCLIPFIPWHGVSDSAALNSTLAFGIIAYSRTVFAASAALLLYWGVLLGRDKSHVLQAPSILLFVYKVLGARCWWPLASISYVRECLLLCSAFFMH